MSTAEHCSPHSFVDSALSSFTSLRSVLIRVLLLLCVTQPPSSEQENARRFCCTLGGGGGGGGGGLQNPIKWYNNKI